MANAASSCEWAVLHWSMLLPLTSWRRSMGRAGGWGNALEEGGAKVRRESKGRWCLVANIASRARYVPFGGQSGRRVSTGPVRASRLPGPQHLTQSHTRSLPRTTAPLGSVNTGMSVSWKAAFPFQGRMPGGAAAAVRMSGCPLANEAECQEEARCLAINQLKPGNCQAQAVAN